NLAGIRVEQSGDRNFLESDLPRSEAAGERASEVEERAIAYSGALERSIFSLESSIQVASLEPVYVPTLAPVPQEDVLEEPGTWDESVAESVPVVRPAR